VSESKLISPAKKGGRGKDSSSSSSDPTRRIAELVEIGVVDQWNNTIILGLDEVRIRMPIMKDWEFELSLILPGFVFDSRHKPTAMTVVLCT